MSDGRDERRSSARKDERAEMVMGASRAEVSNLSAAGAFVAVLTGLRPEDTFSFELLLDESEETTVKGRAVVKWSDPGVGVGVRFELEPDERTRLALYLDRLDQALTESAVPDSSYDPPRASTRRTIAVGTEEPDGFTKVWFRYLPPGKPDSSD